MNNTFSGNVRFILLDNGSTIDFSQFEEMVIVGKTTNGKIEVMSLTSNIAAMAGLIEIARRFLLRSF